MTNAIGLDISHWQNDKSTPQVFDPAKAYAAGARFVFIKASEAVYLDQDFVMNWHNCKGVLPRGAYHFFRWQWNVIEQARFFAGVLAKDPGELPPVIDYESRNGVPDRVQAVARLEQFVIEFERISGRQLMVYTGPSYWREYGSTAVHWRERPLWIANYGVTYPSVPAPWTSWDFWQYTDKGDGLKFGAESLNIDMNWYSGTFEEMLERFNIMQPEPPPLAETQLDRIENHLIEVKKMVKEIWETGKV